MRLLFVVDGRSPIALNWIRHFVDSGHEVHLISTYPCQPNLDLASQTVIPVAFTNLIPSAPVSRIARGRSPSQLPGRNAPHGMEASGRLSRPSPLLRSGTIGLRRVVRHWLGPFTLRPAARRASAEVDRIQPHLVHAMRIPFEGMLAAAADPPVPLLISVWGNDFTLHASASPGMRALTRRALRRAQALHADCERDRRLAKDWGFRLDRPSIVLPSNGGVRPDVFALSEGSASPGTPLRQVLAEIPQDSPVVINPRGFRGYVRNDTFFRAIPLILAEHPAAIFLCPAMEGERRAEGWLSQLGIAHAVRLLPQLSPRDMAAAYRRAQVMVSPTEHDGTPNTLLEAMACGVFPVAGDLESIREWIETSVNGLLIDPAHPESLAGAVIRALQDTDLRARAAEHNSQLISQRAQHPDVMAKVEALYRSIID